MSLRDELVEAAARAVAKTHGDALRYDLSDSYREHALTDMGLAFDAILDTLEANKAEWDDRAEALWQVSPIDEQRDWWHPHFRIAALRPPVSRDGEET